MPYAPGVSYDGQRMLYDSMSRAGEQFNQFLAGFLMPGTPTGDVPNPNAPDMAAFNRGEGPVADPNATMKRPGPSLMDRFSAGAKSSLEGFDKFKQDADESNALEKLLKTMYPDQKTKIDTMSLGEKRGMLQADQVQKATATAQQLQQTRAMTAKAALMRALAAQQAADDKNNKTPFSPTAGTRTITMADGTTVEIPYITTSTGGAKSLDELVPSNPKYNKPAKTEREPGDGPKLSKDGKFYWDDAGQTWKALPAAGAKGTSMNELFHGATPLDPKNPAGLDLNF